ncbi:MAG: LysR family transcriptional regulator substrate-binding protein [Lachnospiraceae bacterium]|nr:LysR family transcriptional regulator substrate-binding protein [Lachnospiraceae bacterium]
MIGTAYIAYYSWMAQKISAFHVQYPGIQVQICGGYSTELLEKLNTHQIDLCIISQREGNHKWFPICEDEMTAWVPASHPMADLLAFPVEAFAKEPYIETYPGEDIDNVRLFAKCGIKPNMKFATMDSLATYLMVEAGLGLSMNNAINGRVWSGNVRILPLDPPQIVEIGMAAQSNLSPAAQTFFGFVKPYLSEL